MDPLEKTHQENGGDQDGAEGAENQQGAPNAGSGATQVGAEENSGEVEESNNLIVGTPLDNKQAAE